MLLHGVGIFVQRISVIVSREDEGAYKCRGDESEGECQE